MRRQLFFTAFCLPFLLSSCGVNTKGWPNIELDFKNENVISANVCYQRNKDDYAEYLDGKILLTSAEDISSLLQIIECFPIKEEKESSINTSIFATKIIIDFLLDDSFENKYERLAFYEYGIGNSKVMLNNGDVHYLPGRIDIIYESFIN